MAQSLWPLGRGAGVHETGPDGSLPGLMACSTVTLQLYGAGTFLHRVCPVRIMKPVKRVFNGRVMMESSVTGISRAPLPHTTEMWSPQQKSAVVCAHRTALGRSKPIEESNKGRFRVPRWS